MAEAKTVDVVDDDKKEEKKKPGPKPKTTAAKAAEKDSVKEDKKAEELKAEELKAEAKELVQVKPITAETIKLHRPVCLYTGKSINSARRMIFGVIQVLEDDGKEFIKVQGHVRGVGKVVGYVKYSSLYTKSR